MKLRNFFIATIIMWVMVLACTFAHAGDKNLTFQWDHDDPVAQDVVEFRIYASMASGVYDKANDLLETIPFTGEQTEYTGSGVLTSQQGMTVRWYFVVTAVDSEGNESGFSNEVFEDIDFEAPVSPVNFTVRVGVQPSQ